MTETLHAYATNTLLHAEREDERELIYTIVALMDESGNVLVDQSGDILTAFGQSPVVVLHAEETNTLLHAEDSENG